MLKIEIEIEKKKNNRNQKGQKQQNKEDKEEIVNLKDSLKRTKK